MRRMENLQRISYRFLHEATNPLSFRFLREATGTYVPLYWFRGNETKQRGNKYE